ncbi:MAG: 50S ribosomal protein L17 [Thermodesulfobacteriota bacterium]
MRHNRDEKRFNRHSGHLRCMMANMTNSLFLHGRINTTTPKAKELRRVAERMVTLGKQGDMPARRRAMAFMRSKDVVTKLFNEIAPRYRERNGGYTRIVKIGPRPGDAAPMSLIELVEESTPSPKKSKKGTKPKTKKSS